LITSFIGVCRLSVAEGSAVYHGGAPYTDTGGGFTVTVPTGWKFINSPSGFVKAIVTDERSQRMIFKWTDLAEPLPHTKRTLTPDLSPEEVGGAVNEDLAEDPTVKQLQIIESAPAVVDGQPSWTTVARFKNLELRGADMMMLVYSSIHDGRLYILKLDAKAGNFFGDAQPVFEEAVRSFHYPAGAAASPADSRAPVATAPAPAAPAPSTLAPGDHCYLVYAPGSMRDIVRAVAAKTTPPIEVRFDGEPRSELCERRVTLSPTVYVDRRRQNKNQGGAIAVPGAGLLAMITPWSCPTTYALSAKVTDSAGGDLASVSDERHVKKIGSMVMCPDAPPPSNATATELVTEVFKKMTQSETTAPATSPPP